jgi:predicted RNA-binding protein with PUA-like domain
MAYWLIKSEPDCYSYDDLVRDQSTAWDGVVNALARKHLRAFAVGDTAFYYLTGKVKAVVGIAAVTAVALDDDGVPVVTIAPKEVLKAPVTLAAIKADGSFADWELVRISRLSVMPVTAEVWAKVLALATT